MNTEIGAYDSATRTVAVTFTSGDLVHERKVNACHSQAGDYDVKATEARIAQVRLGVIAKIAVGAIVAQEEGPAIDVQPVEDQSTGA